MRILIEKMMFHLPCIIETQAVREYNLFQRVLEQAVFVVLIPGTGEL